MEVEKQKGLVKVCWADVRQRVAKVEPTFAKIVDELNPNFKANGAVFASDAPFLRGCISISKKIN